MNTAQNSRRLLIIAPPGSYRLSPYIKSAQKLNLIPLIASVSEYSLLPRGCDGIHINLNKPVQALQSILQLAKDKPFIGILGTDDETIELASQVASQLNLPHNPASATRLTQRKDLARDFLLKAGANIPWHKKLHIQDDIDIQHDIPYPVVVKPLNLSASRGIIRTNNALELKQAIAKIAPIIQGSYDNQAKEHVLIEQYIPGVEIALEGLLHDNDMSTLAIFDKPDPLEGPYFEETYYITPSRLPSSILLTCQQVVLKACQTLGLITGPVHAELRIDDNGKPWILEVAARTIGGDCGQSLKPSNENSLEELVISYAINEPIKPEPQQGSSGVLMIPVPKAGILKRVEGLMEARKVENITSLTIDIPIGNEVHCLPESSSYLGFIFSDADTPEATEHALRQAHQYLNFVIHPVWKIDNQ